MSELTYTEWLATLTLHHSQGLFLCSVPGTDIRELGETRDEAISRAWDKWRALQEKQT